MRKIKTITISLFITILFVTGVFSQTVTDIDGNVYQTVTIGEQTWMAENLKVTKYRDGTAISTGHSNSEWSTLSTGAYAVYDNNSSNAETYGYLYNWYAVDDSRNIAPEGWHVPTDAEWTTLTDFLGSDAGGKLKETGTTHWNSPNTGATNSSGFTALGGVYRFDNGYYYNLGNSGAFWSSTEGNSNYAWIRGLDYDGSDVYRGVNGTHQGFGVRCVRGVSIHNIPADYPNIQGGIDASSDGDTVLVQPGTYTENINYNGKNIVVGSLYLTTSDTSYISSTIIDGNESGSVVKFVGNESSSSNLIGFTIQNGLIPSWIEGGLGGGIRISDATPIISHLIIKDNTAYRGGGIYSNASARISEWDNPAGVMPGHYPLNI
jgi:uncharacterized protein (TIGR02145 family)